MMVEEIIDPDNIDWSKSPTGEDFVKLLNWQEADLRNIAATLESRSFDLNIMKKRFLKGRDRYNENDFAEIFSGLQGLADDITLAEQWSNLMLLVAEQKGAEREERPAESIR